MNKTVILLVLIIALTALICFYIYTQNSRFALVSNGDGRGVYKIDKKTGESAYIFGSIEYPVESDKPSKNETIEDRAIRLAKNAETLNPKKYVGDGVYTESTKNDYYIKDFLEKQTGSLQIIGWQAHKFDEQIYVVTYKFSIGNHTAVSAFEVNLQAEIVRNITGNPELEKKYGYGE